MCSPRKQTEVLSIFVAKVTMTQILIPYLGGTFYCFLSPLAWWGHYWARVMFQSKHAPAICPQTKNKMAAAGLPATLKAVQAYLKTAQEYDKRDPVLAYYCK